MRVLITDDNAELRLIEAAEVRIESEAIIIEPAATVESAFWVIPGEYSVADEVITRYILFVNEDECSDMIKAEYEANPDSLNVKIKNMLIDALRTGFIDFSAFGKFGPEYLHIGNTGCFYP